MGVYGDGLTSGAGLKWPLEKLQFFITWLLSLDDLRKTQFKLHKWTDFKGTYTAESTWNASGDLEERKSIRLTADDGRWLAGVSWFGIDGLKHEKKSLKKAEMGVLLL